VRIIVCKGIRFYISTAFFYFTEKPKCFGFEKNENGVFGPKLARMKNQMDPVALADSQSMLNLKLMKWRLVPELNLDHFTTKKYSRRNSFSKILY